MTLQSQDTVQLLRKEALTNPAFNSICTVFAFRERARSTVTVAALHKRLERNGFKVPRQQVEKALSTLATLGFGTLKTNSKKRVIALHDVKTTFQSIGAAAIDKKDMLDAYKEKSQNRFETLKAPVERAEKVAMMRRSTDAAPKNPNVSIKLDIEGLSYVIEVPDNSTSQQISRVVESLRRASAQ